MTSLVNHLPVLLCLFHTLRCLVLSCPCRWCELNWRQIKTVFSGPQYIWDWTVANWKLVRDKTKLFLSCRHFSSNLRHGQDDSFVLSVSAVWNKTDTVAHSADAVVGQQWRIGYNTGSHEWWRWVTSVFTTWCRDVIESTVDQWRQWTTAVEQYDRWRVGRMSTEWRTALHAIFVEISLTSGNCVQLLSARCHDDKWRLDDALTLNV